MLNRSKAPNISLSKNPGLTSVQTAQLNNGIPVYTINSGVQKIMMAEFVFEAGRSVEFKKQAAYFTNALLKEGTKTKSAQQLSNAFEYYGASIKTIAGYDFCSIIITCLSKYFEQVIAIIAEIILHPIFNESELEIFRANQLQQLKINLSKHEYIANKKTNSMLWGNNHAYGYPTTTKDIEAVNKQDLLNHYNAFYKPENCKVFIGGRPPEKYLETLNSFFGNWSGKKVSAIPKQYKMLDYSFPKIEDAHQASLRLTFNSIGKQHPNFTNFYVLNTILGGYFGSRLMMNIREANGFTYGIYSMLFSMRQGAQCVISTEVGKQNIDDTLSEITKEIVRLKTELIGEEELTMVKNYLSGYCLTLIDGPFNQLSILKEMELMNLSHDNFDNFAASIQTINAKQIIETAQQYLPNVQDMIMVCEG